MTRWFIGIGVLMAMGAGWVLVSDASSSSDPGASFKDLKVAVVDIKRVLRESKGAVARKEAHEAWVAKNQSKISEREKQIESLTENLEMYDKNHPDFIAGADALELEKFGLKQLYTRLEQQRELRVVENHRVAYEEMMTAVNEYAAANGVDLVLQKDRSPVRGGSEEEIITRILWRQVVWSHDALDITDDVLNILNK